MRIFVSGIDGFFVLFPAHHSRMSLVLQNTDFSLPVLNRGLSV